MSLEIRVADPKKEGVLQASKWMYQRVLLEKQDLESLFECLGNCYLLYLSKIDIKEKLICNTKTFFEIYDSYLASIKNGEKFDKKEFSLALSKTLDPLYLMEVKPGVFLVKIKEPVVRLQLFQFHYLEQIHEFVLTDHLDHGISWGLEFSFPQFYQDHQTCKAIEHFKDASNANTVLFKKIQKWLRDQSDPVHFKVGDLEKRVSFRIGKKCLPWICEHAQLKKEGLQVLNKEKA